MPHSTNTEHSLNTDAPHKQHQRYMSPLNHELIDEEEWAKGLYENEQGYVLLAEEIHFRILAEDVVVMAQDCLKRDMAALHKADVIDAFVASSMNDDFEDGEQEADTRPLKALLHKAIKADKIILESLQKDLDACCKSMNLIAHRPTQTRIPCKQRGLMRACPSLVPRAPHYR